MTAFVAAALIAAVILPSSVSAANVELWTDYPSVSIQPGGSINFSLTVENNTSTGQTVDLEVVEAPEGWTTTLRGGGREVRSVYARAGDTGSVGLEVVVPDGVAAASYELVIGARGPAGSARLPLTLVVDESAPASAEVTVDYPILEGPSGAQFDYSITLHNNSAERKLFALEAGGQPGWQVTFEAVGNEQVASFPVDAGSSERINVSVRAPERVEAGEYSIPVRASAEGVSAETVLTVVITGTYELRVRPVDDRLSFDATAGSAARVQLLVENTGTAPLEGVRLSGSPPSDWEAGFEPEAIETVPAGETRQVTMTVRPKDQAVAGDYNVSVSAQAEQASDRIEFRVAVGTPTLWGWFGLLLVAAAIAGTFTLFRVYGRR